MRLHAGAPDRVVLAASDRIDHTKQRRFGAAWRTGFMRINWQLATAAVVGVLLIVLGAAWMTRPSGGVGGPAATPSPSPTAVRARAGRTRAENLFPITAADLTATFTSPLHGFAVRYPNAWTVTPATLTWICGMRNDWGSSINDELTMAGVARFSGASQRLAEDGKRLTNGSACRPATRIRPRYRRSTSAVIRVSSTLTE